VDVQVLRKIPTIALPEMRERPELAEMIVLKKGNRLSITPVEPRHWKAIVGKM
jgi:predicted RNA-binding protein with PUA-like domain